MKHGWWWSINGGLGRPSVLGEIVQILNSPAHLMHGWAFPRGIYRKEDEYIVGAGYLQVAIYMQCEFIFNCLTWWLVDWQDDLWISWPCQTECQCSRIQWVVHVLCPLCCVISFFPVAWFSICSVCHAQYEQFCIWVSILNPIFLVYSWSRLCLLVGKKVVSCLWVFCAFLKWFSSSVFFAMASARQWFSKLSHPDSRSPKKYWIGSRSWCRGRFRCLP